MDNVNFLFNATVNGAGPTVVSSTPMVRTQGNGHLTGFIRQVWSDGSTTDDVFVENAKSVDDVRASYLSHAA